MKRILYTAFASLIFILLLNVLTIKNIRNKHNRQHQHILFTQTQLCGEHIEKTISNYENELNRIIYYNSKNLHMIFSNEKIMSEVITNLKSFYSKHRNLLSNISIYDNSNNYLGLYIKENDEFVVDTFSRQRENVLYEKQLIKKQDDKYLTSFPFFKENELVGNIVAEINFHRYLSSVFNFFYIMDIQWQWLANTNAEILYSNREGFTSVSLIDSITSGIINENEGSLNHYNYESSGRKKLLSSYYPLFILNRDLCIVFSMDTDENLTKFSNMYLFLVAVNLLLFTLLFFYILVLYIKQIKKGDSLSSNLLTQRMIIEHFPVGIMILDKNGIIRNINLTGQKMLFLDTDQGLIGKSFNDQFLISNKYLLKEGINLPFDSNHFILYERDGNEVVIYRKEITTYIAGDELTISALIDVSPFEKSRKQEVAANMSKSDFLAKMSHEIRTPMNGIIGMTESLLRSNIPEEQKEQAIIIKKSSALLMNVINDILDFSKIEAGKMMLEEIPFNLNEEINLIIELFKPLANEKDIALLTAIKPNVPAKLIGDPFRLRQVLSNLLSNAIKFTEKGKVILSIELIENYNSTIVLMFSVEDTGIGIAKENINKIFDRYEQVRQPKSKQYGGSGLGMSIARQLVEMMNGEIWVESPANISEDTEYPGSRISFTIETHSNEKLSKKFDFSSFTRYQQLTALILSKNKSETDQVQTILDSFGINFVHLDYEEMHIDSVLFHLEQKRDLYQIIVISDKDGCGFHMANLLKDKKYSDQYLIIFATSNDKQGNYLKARNFGIDYYLIQPHESNEVFKILQTNFQNIKEEKSMSTIIDQIRPGLKILIADDNLINQRVTQTIFKHLGYEIDIASNGAEAVKMIEEDVYDIVFMDLLMPVMDGYTAVREIRKTNKTIPVIAMSAAEEQSSQDEAFSSGVNDFLVKPIKVEVIKQMLIKWFLEKI